MPHWLPISRKRAVTGMQILDYMIRAHADATILLYDIVSLCFFSFLAHVRQLN